MPCCEKIQVLKQKITENNKNISPCQHINLGFTTHIVKSKMQKYIAVIILPNCSADE